MRVEIDDSAAGGGLRRSDAVLGWVWLENVARAAKKMRFEGNSVLRFGSGSADHEFEAVVDLVRQLRPRLVLVTGDLTQRARRTQFADARAFVDRLASPSCVLAGNHDIPLFNLAARFLHPYANFTRAFGAEREREGQGHWRQDRETAEMHPEKHAVVGQGLFEAGHERAIGELAGGEAEIGNLDEQEADERGGGFEFGPLDDRGAADGQRGGHEIKRAEPPRTEIAQQRDQDRRHDGEEQHAVD